MSNTEEFKTFRCSECGREVSVSFGVDVQIICRHVSDHDGNFKQGMREVYPDD